MIQALLEVSKEGGCIFRLFLFISLSSTISSSSISIILLLCPRISIRFDIHIDTDSIPTGMTFLAKIVVTILAVNIPCLQPHKPNGTKYPPFVIHMHKDKTHGTWHRNHGWTLCPLPILTSQNLRLELLDENGGHHHSPWARLAPYVLSSSMWITLLVCRIIEQVLFCVRYPSWPSCLGKFGDRNCWLTAVYPFPSLIGFDWRFTNLHY